jgi:hypothetical protein
MDFFIKEQTVLQDQMKSLLQAAPSSVWKEMAERNLTLWRDMQRDLLRTFISSSAGPARKDEKNER